MDALTREPHTARDLKLLTEACRYAAEFSMDPHTQNGALLLSVMGEVVLAANTMPEIETRPERFIRPKKYLYIEHAERNAIYLAARRGICTERATLYVPWFACADCARAIIQAGVQRVVGHIAPWLQTPDRWKDSVRAAESMLAEAGVATTYVEDELGVSLLFDGKLLTL